MKVHEMNVHLLTNLTDGLLNGLRGTRPWRRPPTKRDRSTADIFFAWDRFVPTPVRVGRLRPSLPARYNFLRWTTGDPPSRLSFLWMMGVITCLLRGLFLSPLIRVGIHEMAQVWTS